MNKKFSTRRRLAVILLAVGLLLFICIGRAVGLVLINGSEYEHKALAQAAGSSKTILARPGNIMDSNGLYLTSTRKQFRLILDPKAMAETENLYPGSLERTVSIVAEAFSLSEDELRGAFTENPKSQYVRFPGAPVLEEEQVEGYEELVKAFNEAKKKNNDEVAKNGSGTRITARVAGVWFEEQYARSYPFGDLLSKTIGYTTADTTEALMGLELQYGTALRGRNGRQYTYVDEKGNVTTEVTEAENGYTLFTSLDTNIARILKEEIASFLQENGAGRVNVLVMNPKNGEIIALESDTEFDLNDPTNLRNLFTDEELEDPSSLFLLQEAYLNNPAALENMTREEQLSALLMQVQRNYPVSNAYEPGSTAKTLTIAAGIETGLISPTDTWYCDGAIGVEDYVIHCHQPTLCGDLTPMEALGRSCNVCLVQIGEILGPSVFSKYQEIFNLGQRTGIDLPGEANTAYMIYPEKALGEIELATNTFGQGYAVTMVQFASMYASILNGGYYYQPHIVRRIADSTGNTVKEIGPTLVRRTISQETSKYIKDCLRYVCVNGTANFWLNPDGYDLGGKTGASEKLPRGTGKYVVSFIGAAPVEDPEFIVYVVIDEPDVEDQSSSVPAQMLASSIFKRLYTYYNVYRSDDPDAYEYDWTDIHKTDGTDDGAGGEPNVDDPDDTIDWIDPSEEDQDEPLGPEILPDAAEPAP
ncbi:MAG: hypothetical protein IKG97_07110 [Lachnospiraceae bacterium]|nr:hypothetical protein [Lachnospiraceae bacterium]